MTDEKALEAVEYEDGVRIVRVETEDKSFLLPYISFRLGDLNQIDRRKDIWNVELTFDQGIVTLAGQNFEEFILELQRERVAIIRVGKSKEPDGPEIRSVQVRLREE